MACAALKAHARIALQTQGIMRLSQLLEPAATASRATEFALPKGTVAQYGVGVERLQNTARALPIHQPLLATVATPHQHPHSTLESVAMEKKAKDCAQMRTIAVLFGDIVDLVRTTATRSMTATTLTMEHVEQVVSAMDNAGAAIAARFTDSVEKAHYIAMGLMKRRR